MSDFDYALDVDEDYGGEYGNDELGWRNAPPPPPPPSSQWKKNAPPPPRWNNNAPPPPRWNNNAPPLPPGPIYRARRPNSGYMNAQYSEAFGDYRGGYGPGGGFGAPPPRFQPYPPGRQRGRGFGPVGQPPQHRVHQVHRAAFFLEKCDIDRQQIKVIPRNILDMIEPEYCGVCAMSFESFPVAKIHYSSKSHLKSQKKLMGQNRSTKNLNEVPIKARNLYCELCDVHITSTAHADSHYSGKSHRSIVEGLKPPKNPIILQMGMENRLEQLIRREKKHMKISQDAEASAEEKLPPLEKNVSPDLYCQICKTSVSCTEQMTSHLNGKKHLTKEKQYILKMMKGNNAENEAEKVSEENAEVAQEDVQEEQEDVQEDAKEEQEDAKEEQGGVQEENPAETAADFSVDDWSAGGGGDWDTQSPAQKAAD